MSCLGSVSQHREAGLVTKHFQHVARSILPPSLSIIIKVSSREVSLSPTYCSVEEILHIRRYKGINMATRRAKWEAAVKLQRTVSFEVKFCMFSLSKPVLSVLANC